MPSTRDVFRVSGRHLYDRCGERVVLRGVNKMAVWTGSDPTCAAIFPEIARTGANAVRIVWLTETSGVPHATVANMDQAIANCRAEQLIPMIELHDATGDWSKLPALVAYWTRTDVVDVLKKHQAYLLLNIGNEVGNSRVKQKAFRRGYEAAIRAIRETGVKVPLVIDAANWGQEVSYLLNHAPCLLSIDPEHNLIFSLHVWWHFHTGLDAQTRFTNAVEDAVTAGIPFIVGEFSGVCQNCDNANDDAPYEHILTVCEQHEIGWLAWEWGPGNEYGTPPCPEMNMTTNGQLAGLQPGWASSVVRDHPFSLAQRSVRPYSMTHGGRCESENF